MPPGVTFSRAGRGAGGKVSQSAALPVDSSGACSVHISKKEESSPFSHNTLTLASPPSLSHSPCSSLLLSGVTFQIKHLYPRPCSSLLLGYLQLTWFPRTHPPPSPPYRAPSPRPASTNQNFPNSWPQRLVQGQASSPSLLSQRDPQMLARRLRLCHWAR